MNEQAQFNEYLKRSNEAQAAEARRFANKTPGWYGRYYYDGVGDNFRIVESVDSDNEPYYKD